MVTHTQEIEYPEELFYVVTLKPSNSISVTITIN